MLDYALIYNCSKGQGDKVMKTDFKGWMQMANNINKVRIETNHTHGIIRGADWNTAKYIWEHSKNSKEFREWFKVEMGWGA